MLGPPTFEDVTRARSALSEFQDLSGCGPVWTCAPEVLSAAVYELGRLGPGRRLAASSPSARALVAAVRPYYYTGRSRALWCVTSRNQRRIAETVDGPLEPIRPRASALARIRRRLAAQRRHHRATAEAIASRLQAAGYPANRSLTSSLLFSSARWLLVAEALLEGGHHPSVVVATQHSASARALIAASRVRALPSVYIPHAPVADNGLYFDIPTTFALLRGPREAAWYVDRGAHEAGIRVFGYPLIDRTWYPARVDPERCVIALPVRPNRSDVVGAVQLLHGYGFAHLDICPHPATTPAQLRASVPGSPHIRLRSDRSTADVLREGPSALFQWESGVGLDALILGIMLLDDYPTPPGYPYLRRPWVHFIGDPDWGRDPLPREELSKYGRSWAIPNRGTARDDFLKVMGSLAGTDAKPVLDSWSPA